MGLARTLDKGHVQGYITPGIIGAAGGGTGGVAPMFEGGIKYGITDNAEIGARLGLSGLSLQGKFSLMRSPTMDTGLDMALAPEIGGVFYGATGGASSGGGGALSFALPLLIGFNMGGHQFILGPKLADSLIWGGVSSGGAGGSTTINVLMGGASVGFALKVGDSFRLLPEVSALYPIVGAASTSVGGTSSGGVGFGGQALIFQFGLGLVFGGYEGTPAASTSTSN
jgi:hypothetical protein